MTFTFDPRSFLRRARLRAMASGLTFLVVAAFLGPFLVVTEGTARAQALGTADDATPRELRSVKVDEQLDAQVPLDATFHDQDGKAVRLGDLLDRKRPMLLTFAYFNCPVLCSLILNSAVSSMVKIPWTIGKEFDVVTISIDPNETAERAKAKRESLLGQYGRTDAEHGWHFLLGDAAQIARVTGAVGYRFHYDEETKQFAHPGTLILLQPNGRVSRYLYGLEYPPETIRLGLLEASQGKLIKATEQILLFCYRYDAHQGKYVIMANRVMQVGAAIIALLLGGFLGVFWYREKKNAGSRASPNAKANAAMKAEERSEGGTVDGPSGGVGLTNVTVTPMENRT